MIRENTIIRGFFSCFKNLLMDVPIDNIFGDLMRCGDQ